MKIELTDQEKNFLINLLNQAPVRGVDAMVLAVNLVNKLSQSPLVQQAPPVPKIGEQKEKNDNKTKKVV